jgi:hypothetical protein
VDLEIEILDHADFAKALRYSLEDDACHGLPPGRASYLTA